MNCPKCGNPLVSNMNFCTKCGTPVPQQPTAPQQPVRPQATVMPQQPVNKTQQAPARPKEFLQYDAPKKQPQNVVKPQPPKQPVQPTYPQNNPPKVQPQPAPQSFVTPQPTPQNVAIQSPKPPKKKKSNKNLPLIIVAAVLVLAVLASTIAVVPGIIRNKNEINAATEYIEEFPTLKQKTSLLVYDINKFPSEKYEIKVEKMFMGGVLNGVFKGKTILEDVYTEQIYDIDFKEDGDYRITLTDKTEPTESTETEVIEIVIIIDVKVDNDAEDAVDSVDIHSPENPAVKRLEATQEDWKFMTELFSELQFYSNDYDCTSSDANYQAVGDITFLTLQIYDICAEHYGFSEKEFCETDRMGVDPLARYNDRQKFEGYVRFDAEAVDWIVENIYNVQPLADEDLNEDTGTYAWYRYEGYYYTGWIATGEEWYPETTLINHKQMPDGKYEVDVNTRFIQFDETAEEYNYKIITALNEVDGKRVWTFYEWEISDNSGKTAIAAESCGADGGNVTWTLHDDGELVISGSGKMNNYHPLDAPWYSVRDSISKVTIDEGVTTVGSYAFYTFDSITSITIPDSVTEIGDNAFYCCHNLSNIIISDNITSIGTDAFFDTGYYNDIANWENNALYIDNYLIAVKNFNIRGEYTIRDGTKIIAGGAFSCCKELTKITIPSSVERIGYRAFTSCNNITSVEIPNSVLSIDNETFFDCSQLINVSLPDSIKSIGNGAFHKTKLYDDSSKWDNGALYIGNHLIEVKDEVSGTYVVKSGTKCIANGAFARCHGITTIKIPNSVTSIDDYTFNSCDLLKDITIPESVETIGDYAFYGCGYLTNVYYTGTKEQWNSITIKKDNADLLNATIHYNS